MDYSWNNLNNIYNQVQTTGMMSVPHDIVACWLLFGSLPKINRFLELGSYIGGGLAIFNDALHETGHTDVEFTGVDHLDFVGDRATNSVDKWYTAHFNKSLSEIEIQSLSTISCVAGMQEWIQNRTERLTNKKISLKCYLSEYEVNNQYDIIHHDYGNSLEENLGTIKNCLPKLSENGVYIVDDWGTGAPFRTWATVIAQQEGLLYPFMWGNNKVFFSKSISAAQETVKKICNNPNYSKEFFKFKPGSDYFGQGYVTIRMNWQSMQWN